jgi:hypothetical protein
MCALGDRDIEAQLEFVLGTLRITALHWVQTISA